MTPKLSIDVYFDFICPWCLIGKRKLELALAGLHADHPGIDVEIRWQGVQLLQDLPIEGEPFDAFYRNRLGSAEAVARRQHQVRQAAADAGVAIDLASIRRMPNTAAAHRLFAHAGTLGTTAQRDALLERLFSAYFQRGEDLGDPATLSRIMQECGFPTDGIDPLLRGNGGRFVPAFPDTGPAMVPLFVINGKYRISGAQPADVLEGALYGALAPAEAGGRTA
ncbi:DSBA oxidoreductase [Marinobacterium nitratireducens]|uniref:DSBA oxidoreductase n=1 Tax=Marinobacterium nitratireducens TaxID=518897 RepID=A0A917ZJ11_9GAMM|nr:DsbA family oxidoreductase [Marinobacterium nitratireducens]GGO84262.1 DSBA oxidoreductase [Marinobacterium nitratireducens]